MSQASVRSFAFTPRDREGLSEQCMVRLTPSDRRALERLAASEDRGLGYLIREAVKRYLAERGEPRN